MNLRKKSSSVPIVPTNGDPWKVLITKLGTDKKPKTSIGKIIK
jgi:hypothetical protein